jgi:hypothetical protein
MNNFSFIDPKNQQQLVLEEINKSALLQDLRFRIFNTDRYHPKAIREDFSYVMKFSIAVINAHSLFFDMPQVACRIMRSDFTRIVDNARNFICHNPVYKLESQYSLNWFERQFPNKTFGDISNEQWKSVFEKFNTDSSQYMKTLLSYIKKNKLDNEEIRKSIIHKKNIENAFWDFILESYTINAYPNNRLYPQKIIEEWVTKNSSITSVKEFLTDIEDKLNCKWKDDPEFYLNGVIWDILTEEGLI